MQRSCGSNPGAGSYPFFDKIACVTLPLESKTALVTGASKGVGKGIALELARAGANIVANYNRDSAGADATVAEIRGLGRDAFAVQADVGVAADVARMFGAALERFPRLDILVNNAGVQTWKPLLDLEEREWDRTIDTNLKGCFLCTQRAARHMKEQGGGHIVNIGSGCNKVAFPKLVDYTASKGGIEMFTKVAAVELGRYRITVNCVAPGAMEIDGPERSRRLRGHLGETDTARTCRPTRRCRARRGISRERCGGVHYGADDLGGWRIV